MKNAVVMFLIVAAGVLFSVPEPARAETIPHAVAQEVLSRYCGRGSSGGSDTPYCVCVGDALNEFVQTEDVEYIEKLLLNKPIAVLPESRFRLAEIYDVARDVCLSLFTSDARGNMSEEGQQFCHPTEFVTYNGWAETLYPTKIEKIAEFGGVSKCFISMNFHPKYQFCERRVRDRLKQYFEFGHSERARSFYLAMNQYSQRVDFMRDARAYYTYNSNENLFTILDWQNEPKSVRDIQHYKAYGIPQDFTYVLDDDEIRSINEVYKLYCQLMNLSDVEFSANIEGFGDN